MIIADKNTKWEETAVLVNRFTEEVRIRTTIQTDGSVAVFASAGEGWVRVK